MSNIDADAVNYGIPACSERFSERSADVVSQKKYVPAIVSMMNMVVNCVLIKSVLQLIGGFRKTCGALINNFYVQLFIIALICLNAIMMGVATFSFVTKNDAVFLVFEMIDKVFLWIFTVELILQFIFHGFYLLFDGWLVFDLVVILLSWSFATAKIIRAFRILRALRLVSRVQAMKDIVVCLFAVVPQMIAISGLLGIINYIASVMFTTLFKDSYVQGITSRDYFSSLSKSAITLFQIMTMDGWSDICRELMEVYWWAWIPFCSYVILTGFIVVNLIIAVICDAISDITSNMEEEERLELAAAEKDGAESDDLSEAKDEVHGQILILEAEANGLIQSQARAQMMISDLTKNIQAMVSSM